MQDQRYSQNKDKIRTMPGEDQEVMRLTWAQGVRVSGEYYQGKTRLKQSMTGTAQSVDRGMTIPGIGMGQD